MFVYNYFRLSLTAYHIIQSAPNVFKTTCRLLRMLDFAVFCHYFCVPFKLVPASPFAFVFMLRLDNTPCLTCVASHLSLLNFPRLCSPMILPRVGFADRLLTLVLVLASLLSTLHSCARRPHLLHED
jgi:hypothetical protein